MSRCSYHLLLSAETLTQTSYGKLLSDLVRDLSSQNCQERGFGIFPTEVALRVGLDRVGPAHVGEPELRGDASIGVGAVSE